MNPSAIQFIVVSLVVAIIVTAFFFKKSGVDFVDYIKTREGKGALASAIKFIAVAVSVVLVWGALTSSAEAKVSRGDWLAYSEVFVGLDHTFSQSPQCEIGSVSDRVTSNGGFRANVYRSVDRAFHANIKYTHHSCAFNDDRNSYDAIGIEIVYRFWDK